MVPGGARVVSTTPVFSTSGESLCATHDNWRLGLLRLACWTRSPLTMWALARRYLDISFRDGVKGEVSRLGFPCGPRRLPNLVSERGGCATACLTAGSGGGHHACSLSVQRSFAPPQD